LILAPLLAAAAVGTGVFDLPFDGGKRWHTSDKTHLAFRLPSSWFQSSGNDDQQLVGWYERSVKLGGGASCALKMRVASRAARRPPALTGHVDDGSGNPITVRRRSRPGRAVRWAGGSAGPGFDATRGWRLLPGGLVSRRYRVLDIYATMTIEVDPIPAQTRACERHERRADAVMDAAVASAHLAPGTP
jgi:hypothetical protein